jgi:hypothetical protein
VQRYEKRELNPLLFPERDVEELAAALEEAGYPHDNIILMTRKSAQEKDDSRYAPDAERIRTQLKQLLTPRRPGDTVLVAFAGHGVQFQGDPDSRFCPTDADLTNRKNLIELGEVYKQLEDCKASTKVLLVDACRNDPLAAGARAAGNGLASVTRPPGQNPPESVAVLFSCSPGQVAFEDPDLKHGVFFHFVIEGLRGKASPGHPEVTLGELDNFLVHRVDSHVRRTRNQTQVPECKGVRRGPAVLAVRPKAAGAGSSSLAAAPTEAGPGGPPRKGPITVGTRVRVKVQTAGFIDAEGKPDESHNVIREGMQGTVKKVDTTTDRCLVEFGKPINDEVWVALRTLEAE